MSISFEIPEASRSASTKESSQQNCQAGQTSYHQKRHYVHRRRERQVRPDQTKTLGPGVLHKTHPKTRSLLIVCWSCRISQNIIPHLSTLLVATHGHRHQTLHWHMSHLPDDTWPSQISPKTCSQTAMAHTRPTQSKSTYGSVRTPQDINTWKQVHPCHHGRLLQIRTGRRHRQQRGGNGGAGLLRQLDMSLLVS